MSKDIEKCPFCGAFATALMYCDNDFNEAYYMVKCIGTNMHALDYCGETEEDAIKQWNMRTVQT